MQFRGGPAGAGGLVAAAAIAAALVAAGCGGSGGSSSSPSAEAQSAATGDIPDNQVFLTFHNRNAGYSIQYPEGWTQRGNANDVTFEDGTTDDEYLAALIEHLPGVLDGHRPEIVFYLAGADPYEGDRLGRLKLTIDGLRARDHYVFDTCRAHRIPVVVVMAGGYANDVDAIVTIHTNTIREAVIACASACLPNTT